MKTRTLAPSLLVAMLALVGCSAPAEEPLAGESDEAVSGRTIDPAKFSLVTAVVAVDAEAKALMTELDRTGKKAPGDGGATMTFAGLSQAELEGKRHDPSQRQDIFGIVCQKDGIGLTSCSVTAMVRTANVSVTSVGGGVMSPNKVTLTGKLASAVAAALPAAGRAQDDTRAQGPISCAPTGGTDETECVMATGAGYSETMQFGIDNDESGATPKAVKARAIKTIRQFFPQG